MQSSKKTMKLLRYVFSALLCFTFAGQVKAVELTDTVSVNITSDTAANAKNMAFDEARRQIITDTLAQYSNIEQLKPAVASASNSVLTNMIASSSISGEKQSNTTYSADITMTVDREAAKLWLTENNIQNWLTDGNNSGDVFLVQVIMSDKIANWMNLKQIMRTENIKLDTKYINGNQVTVEIPNDKRGAFTIAVRENGWRYSNQDGILRIWK